jgi:DNA repair exonuclease SbcCD ATPase subunit
MSLAQLRRRTDKLVARYQTAQAVYENEQENLQSTEKKIDDALEAQEMLQRIAQEVQQVAHRNIASVATRCLQTIFEEDYELRINFERKRGKTDARIVFVKNGMEIDPMTASGGGVVDVAAFALRLACLSMSHPPLRRVVLLDEPFRFLSKEYRPRMRQMLELLSKDMDIQFVVVTHFEDLRTGSVVEL